MRDFSFFVKIKNKNKNIFKTKKDNNNNKIETKANKQKNQQNNFFSFGSLRPPKIGERQHKSIYNQIIK